MNVMDTLSNAQGVPTSVCPSPARFDGVSAQVYVDSGATLGISGTLEALGGKAACWE